jgi:cyclopropane-fatty-acyl-phospholipid synthase
MSVRPFFDANLARTSIVALMSKITIGRLRVLAPEQIYEFGPGGGLSAELKVVSDAFWVRLLLLGDLVLNRRPF